MTASQTRRHYFSLHELLLMAALAALGGASSSVVSMAGRTVHAAVGIPGGLQFLAGIHVLWLVLAVGLIRRPGAATVTSLLKGVVELLTGNPHGLLALAYSGVGGIGVDVVWLLLRRRHHPLTFMLAGGAGSASNILVWKFAASLPDNEGLLLILAAVGGVAFASGAVLAGLLGYWLLQALARAGVVSPSRGCPTSPR